MWLETNGTDVALGHPALENPSFVIQVDRTDLDKQLLDQFVAVRGLVGDVKRATSERCGTVTRGVLRPC
jgi:type I site-specific restriction-modification system R (restriction) subunit